MSELQRDIIERLLKEKGKTKRELAKQLGMKENSINRALDNPKISVSKLEIAANFLEVEIQDLLPKKELPALEPEGEYRTLNPSDVSSQMTISNLSEALKRNSKTIDNLVRIIADNFPEKKSADETIF